MRTTRTYVDTMEEMEEEEASFIRITRRRFFFITVRADCIFLRPSAARTGGRGKGKRWGRGGVSNPENHVERGPSNHWCSRQSCPASASLVPARLRDPSSHLGRNPGTERKERKRDRRKGGCPFYSRAVGTRSPPFLSLPFFTLPPSLSLSSPPSSSLFSSLSTSEEIALSPHLPQIGTLASSIQASFGQRN